MPSINSLLLPEQVFSVVCMMILSILCPDLDNTSEEPSCMKCHSELHLCPRKLWVLSPVGVWGQAGWALGKLLWREVSLPKKEGWDEMSLRSFPTRTILSLSSHIAYRDTVPPCCISKCVYSAFLRSNILPLLDKNNPVCCQVPRWLRIVSNVCFPFLLFIVYELKDKISALS